MSFFSEKIKEPKKTQIISKGLVLDELIKEDILNELKEKFSDEGEIITTIVQFHVLPKPEEKKEVEVKKGEEKKLVIGIKALDFVELSHPSEAHFRDKVVVITSNKNATLEKFLK